MSKLALTIVGLLLCSFQASAVLYGFGVGTLVPSPPATIIVPPLSKTGTNILIDWADVKFSGSDGLFNLSQSTTTQSSISGFSSSSVDGQYVLQQSKNGGSWTDVAISGSVSQHTISSLNDGSYRYRVAACQFGCSEYLTSSSLTVARTPATPNSITVPSSAVTDGKIVITWSLSSSATKYTLQESKNGAAWSTLTSTASTNSFSRIDRENGLYKYQVKACNASGCSDYRLSSTVTVLLPPPIPSGISVPTSTVSNGNITVSWSSTNTATKYQLQQQIGSGTWGTLVNTSSRSYSQAGMANGSYKYRVRAYNTSGWSGFRYSSTVTVLLPPTAPSSVTVPTSTINDGRIIISWPVVSTATKYQIQERKGSGNWTTIASTLTSRSYTRTGRQNGTYTYQVRAYNTSGWSGYRLSQPVNVILPPSSPNSLIVPSSDTDGSFNVSWSEVNDVDLYELQQQIASGSWVTLPLIDRLSTRYVVSGLSTNTYKYRVRAIKLGAPPSTYRTSSTVTNVLTPSSITVPSSDTDGAFTVSWASISGASGYLLQQQNGSGSWVTLQDSTATSRAISGLTTSTYRYRVKAKLGSVYGTYRTSSTVTNVLTPSSITVPSADTDGAFTVSWASVSGASGYLLQQQNGNGSWVTLQDSTATSRAISGLTTSTYRYRVKAKLGSVYGTYRTSSTVTNVLTPSSITVPSSDTDGAFTVSWASVSGASGYLLQQQKGNGGWVTLKNDATTSYVISGLTTERYSFRVQARLGSVGGNYKSSPLVLNVLPLAWVNAPATVTTKSVTIEWSPENAATSYDIEQRKGSAPWSFVGNTSSASFVSSIPFSDTYRFRVRAKIDDVVGDYVESSAITANIILDLSDIDDIPLTYPSTVDSNYFGEISGQASVEGGTANYTIPLALPPGRNGMIPSISLAYSSRSGNGLMGMGWFIGGLSSISRCGNSVVHDGVAKEWNYGEDDKLCFNGQRLHLVSGNYGYLDSEYKLEQNNQVTVSLVGGGVNGGSSSYFTVSYPNGKVETYGSTSDAKVKAIGASLASIWAINKSKDLFGNTIDYVYKDIDEGQPIIEQIYYTGSDSTLGNRKVKFDWRSSKLHVDRYHAGYKTSQRYILDNVFIEIEDEQVAEYNLSYKQSAISGRELLTKVSHCAYRAGKTPQCSVDTSFDWEEGSVNFESKTPELAQARLLNYKGSSVGDLDGDGINDFVVTYDVSQNGITDTGEIYSLDSQGNKIWSLEYASSSLGFNKTITDVDGNGQNELLNYSNGLILTEVDRNLSTNERTISSRTISMGTFTCFRKLGNAVVDNRCQFFSSDLDRDGKLDLLYVHEPSYGTEAELYWARNCSTNTETKFCSQQLLANIERDAPPEFHLSEHIGNPPYFYLADWRIAEDIAWIDDINGDGNLDIALQLGGQEPHKFLINKGTQTPSFAEKTPQQIGVNVEPWSNYSKWLDVNGDSKRDFVYLQSSNWYLQINNGAGFNEAQSIGSTESLNIPTLTTSTDGWNSYAQAREQPVNPYFHQMDVNNDGRDELLIPAELTHWGCANVGLNANGPFPEPYWVCSDSVEIEAENRLGAGIVNPRFRYDSLSFKEVNGAYEVESNTTPIAINLVGAMFADIGGDGLIDVINYDGPTETGSFNIPVSGDVKNPLSSRQAAVGITVNLNLNTEKDVELVDILVAVNHDHVDGEKGNWSKFDYANLSEGGQLYNPVRADVEDVEDSFPFTSSMVVVQNHSYNNGANGVANTRYNYKGAVYHKYGRGFQGFLEIGKLHVEQNLKTTTSYEQVFPLVSKVKQQVLCTTVSGSCSQVLSTTTNDWLALEGHSNTYLNLPSALSIPYLNSSVETSFSADSDGGTTELATTTISTTIDDFGNILTKNKVIEEKTENGGEIVSHTTAVTNSYVNQTNSWPNKLLSSKTTKSVVYNSELSGNSNRAKNSGVIDFDSTLTKTYEWDSSIRRVSTETTTADDTEITITQSKTYDDWGNLDVVTVEDENGDRSQNYTASSDGYFLKTLTNDYWRAWTREYDDATGQVTKIVDQNNHEFITSFDALGRPTDFSSAGLPPVYVATLVASDSYCPITALYMQKAVSSGSVDKYVCFDIKGREVGQATYDFLGDLVTSSVSFDERGRVTETIAPHRLNEVESAIRYSAYDNLNRPLNVVVDRGVQQYEINYTYGGFSVNVEISSAESTRTMSRKVNSLGQIVESTDAHSEVTAYRYDAAGNPVIIQDAVNNQIVANYNGLGHKEWFSDPNSGIWSFTYNSFGEMQTQTDARGITTTKTYDKLGRVTSRAANGEQTAKFYYDNTLKGNGVLDYEERGNYKAIFNYDSLQRVISTVKNLDNQVLTSRWAYDSNYGRLKGYQTPSGDLLEYRYNTRGFIQHEVDVSSNSILRTFNDYSLNGSASNITFANGLYSHYNFDETNGSMLSYCVTDSSSRCNTGDQQYVNYSYNGLGYLNTRTNVKLTSSVTATYGYDLLNRLKTVEFSGDNSNFQIAKSYNYDAVGNMLYKSDYAKDYTYGDVAKTSGNAGANAVRQIQLLNNDIVNFSYDDNGNMITGGSLTAVYNDLNKPTLLTRNAITSTFDYDSNHMRYKQVTGNTTTYYDGNYELKITTGNGAKKEHFSYLSDGILVYRNESTGFAQQLRYLHKDRLGSVTLITDRNGNVLQERGFDPFGRTWDESWGDTLSGKLNLAISSKGYTGHEHLDDVDLIHMNGRVYDYNLGRFLSVDPFIQAPGNSQSINPYSYIMNNPLAGTDPTGYFSEGEAGHALGQMLAVALGLKTRESAQVIADAESYVGNHALQGSGDIGATIRTAVEVGTVSAAIAVTTKLANDGFQRKRKSNGKNSNVKTESGNVSDIGNENSKATGIIYERTNLETGECYIGQCKSIERFEQRKKEHNKALGVEHDFKIVERAAPGDALDIAEHNKIQEKTGGIDARDSNLVQNKKNPVGPARHKKLGVKAPKRLTGVVRVSGRIESKELAKMDKLDK